MKRILTGLMLMCLSLPIIAGEGQQQSSLDDLLGEIQQKRDTRSQQVTPEEEVRRLKSQIIDIRVERDRLAEELEYLRRVIDNMESERNSSQVCPAGECVSMEEAEEQLLIRHVVYSLSMYRLGEFMHSVIPATDVEAHKKAQKIMDGAKADLELLGFDTSNPNDFPTLEELLEQFEISHEAHGNRLSTN